MRALTLAEAATEYHRRVSNLLCRPSQTYKDKNHPIFNFLFTYFHFNEKRLYTYSPGVGVVFQREFAQTSGLSKYCVETDADGLLRLAVGPAQFPVEKIAAMRTTLTLLRNCYNKPPLYSCFGLHEWAMLYSPTSVPSTVAIASRNSITDDNSSISSNSSRMSISKSTSTNASNSRHQELPLRISQDEVNRVVERGQLRCTHYDATRFFAKAAMPLNKTLPLPSRINQQTSEQPGCVHAAMDLFKWAIKVYPFLPSDTVADALELALLAREVDMRASPYDLTAYRKSMGGLGGNFCNEPIRIETTEGRKEYVRFQDMVYTKSQPVRKKLIDCYEALLSTLPHN